MQNRVYSFGIITPSKLLKLKWGYPESDAYAEVEKTYDMTGGEACNSAIVLSRLDCQVELDGLWLGNNLRALKTIDILNQFNVLTSQITIKEDFENVEELVIADNETRTIFASYGKLFEGNVIWNSPNEDLIKQADIVCLDPFLQQQSIEAVNICLKHQTPYVTVDCHYNDVLAQEAAVIIIAGEYRKAKFADIDKETLYQKYLESCKGTVIFTSASDNIMYNVGREIRYVTPYQVDAIDTAGAGDSFRAGIIYGMLHNYDLKKTISFASLVASYICQSSPGVMKAPNYKELMDFSQNQKYNYHIKYNKNF